MVICLERGADLHMAQLMPPPLTVSCFSKIQIGFTFLVPAHPGSHGKRAVKQVCVLSGDNGKCIVRRPAKISLRNNVANLRKAPLTSRGPIYKISYDLTGDNRKFIVRSTYNTDLQRAKICLRNIVS